MVRSVQWRGESRVSRERRDKPRRKANWAAIGVMEKERGRERQQFREGEQGESRRGVASRKDRGVGSEGCLFWAAWTLPSSKPSEADGDSIPLASRSPSSLHDPLFPLFTISLFILPFSFARLSSLPLVDPADVLGVPSRPPSRYYGNFEPIRKSIATAAGKSAETACVAARPPRLSSLTFSTSEKMRHLPFCFSTQ